MPIIEMSQKAWFVYEVMKKYGIDVSNYSGTQLESLYDAASSFANVMGNRWNINDALDSILSIISQHNKEQIEKRQGTNLLLGWRKYALESAKRFRKEK
jgi:hypothetical protein